MAEHTPGPWRRGKVRDVNGEANLICGPDDDNDILALITPTRVEWEANATLAAAAPDLLAALEEIAHLTDGQEGRRADTMMMHGFSPVKALGRARDLAHAAIAKARTS